MTVVLDAAHGVDVKGKRSPDGRFLEYLWSRQIISKIKAILDELGIKHQETNTTDKEIGLSSRASACNKIDGKKILISIHANAAGDGSKWMNATGYSIYTTKGKTKSDSVAENMLLSLKAEFPDLKCRFDISDGDLDQEENFTVIYKANCPAVLIEWMFQDSKNDVEILLSDEYNDRFALAIVKSIQDIINKNIV